MNVPLQSVQAAFQDYVLDNGNGNGKPAIADMIADRFGLKAEDRLAIYYDAYRIRLSEALSETFNKTHGYVGDQIFAELCGAYIEKYPSRYRSLRWFGDEFAAFARQYLPGHPVVAELAGFEWALGLAFDAADAPTLTAADLQQLDPGDWECIGFACHPSQQLLTMHWNVPAIWLALEKEEPPPEAVLTEKACIWLIWRKNLQTHFRSLDTCEAAALTGLAQGLSFSRVCADAAESASEDITPRIAGWLHGWISESMLSAVNRRCAESSSG